MGQATLGFLFWKSHLGNVAVGKPPDKFPGRRDMGPSGARNTPPNDMRAIGLSGLELAPTAEQFLEWSLQK